jgi:hypothetical protein
MEHDYLITSSHYHMEAAVLLYCLHVDLSAAVLPARTVPRCLSSAGGPSPSAVINMPGGMSEALYSPAAKMSGWNIMHNQATP